MMMRILLRRSSSGPRAARPRYYLGPGLTFVIEVGVRDEAGNWGYATWTFQLVTFF
jgi:hypothetical protein